MDGAIYIEKDGNCYYPQNDPELKEANLKEKT